MLSPNPSPKTNTKAKDIAFLAIQFLIFLLFIVLPNFYTLPLSKIFFWTGIALGIIGLIITVIAASTLGKSLSPYPTPSAQNQLITSGIFAMIRHPIYTGILFFLLGFSLITGGVSRMILFVAAAILFSRKAAYEEEQLILKYPNYSNYKRKTGKFLPNLSSLKR